MEEEEAAQAALRKQFKDTRTEGDIEEVITDRKQREKESFDCFYEAIAKLMDHLEAPLSEKRLVDILRKTSMLSHAIDVGDAKPVKQRHFPVSPAVEKLLYAEVDRMLKLGVIEESDSAWSSPVVLVQKPGKIPLDPESRDKTAFTIPGKPLYQYKVMPFGLTNASQTMTRLMDKVIPADLRNEVFVY
nr:uncharacterized protein LOC121503304 [Drosophila kikkawai]